MELRELYDDDVLDAFIGEAIRKGKLDIRSFRAMLKEYSRKDTPIPESRNSTAPEAMLTRGCDYYEQMIREGAV